MPLADIISAVALELALQQIRDHLPARHNSSAIERREIKRAGETVGEAKEQHGRDPATGVLEREAALGHFVLLGGAALQVVHAALRVDLGLVLARSVGPLLAGEDVEVVVGGVASRVALGANSCSEDDQVFRDTYWTLVDDAHE